MSESKIKLTGSEFEKALSLTISEIKDKVRKERAESSEKRHASEVITIAGIG